MPAITDALKQTRARKVYVANLRPQVPETAGYTVEDHVAALARHGLDVDVVVDDPVRLARAYGSGHDPAELAVVLRDLVG